MPRRLFLVAALLAAWCACSPALAARSDLIAETTAAQHGLARPWFAQVELDQGRGRIGSVLLYEGVLYVQTTTAMLHAIDAETGKTLWSKQIGDPKHPSMPPDAKGDLLATINGSRLFIVNRLTGELLCEKGIQDAPGGGPAVSSKRVFVPLVTGLILAYRFETDEKAEEAPAVKTKKGATPMSAPKPVKTSPEQKLRIGHKIGPASCQSNGRALVQPLVTRDDSGGEYVVWPTDRGYLNLGRVSHDVDNSLGIKFRLESGATIVTRPAYLPPDPKSIGDAGLVVAASCDGFVYAVQEESGDAAWRFSTGEPIVEAPAVIDDRVYVTTQLGDMYCIDVKTGKSVWHTEGVVQFVAATKARVYATDDIGRLLILNSANGSQLDAMPVGRVAFVLSNSDTDRIYVVSAGGLVQCLHEMEQTKPLMHNKERKDAAKAGLLPPEPKQEVAPKSEKSDKPKKEPAAKKSTETKKKDPPALDHPKKDTKLKPKKDKKAGGVNGLDQDEPPLGKANGKKKTTKPKKGKGGDPF